MNDDELAASDGIAIAEAIRAGMISAEEVVESAIARAESLDALLGFQVTSMVATARAPAATVDADAPLAGVPCLIKDHLALQAGVRHTSGSRYLRDFVATADSRIVRQYRAAGLIPIGTSATCEFALLSTAESASHGPCRNPWDPTRTAGGSSGGAAAAVAAGVVPIAHGNDAAGSIRIPASACGLFGLKPSRHRALVPELLSGSPAAGIWSEHVLTRTVRDSAAVLQTRAAGSARALQIGYAITPPTGTPVDAACEEAVDDAVELCARLGHTVAEAKLPGDFAELERAFLILYTAGAAAWLDHWIGVLGHPPRPGDLEPYTDAVVAHGRGFSPAAIHGAMETLEQAEHQIQAFWADFDVFLTPTLAAPPPPLGYFTADPTDPLELLSRDAEFSPFTWYANAVGSPAMSVPLYWNGDALPIGTHFMAAHGREDLLLALAYELENARPWSMHRPVIFGAPPD
ncbi:6-aminohexanoate-cyclic-dimer hydrolase [Mycolicibacterium litorale]|uniref:amidase n=1 Tax=Mycolicibacterium litorale TaxID=758802 RepID=A0A6S6P2L0_9MYCO|nr:amidase family protein [Mycolicibacterium litorale]BCI52236.1 6-aminohexanoate-cyclic-dimer hydrolase [Mycolicibacterium litorale]